MSETATTRWRWMLAGIALGALFLWLALRQTDWRTAMDQLREADPFWVAVVAVCSIFFMLIKTLRWQFMLRPVTTQEPFARLVKIVYAGTAANLVVAHTGELLRTGIVGRRKGVSSGAVLASIGLERLFDFAALLLFISLALILNPAVSALLWSAGLISLALIGLGMTVILILLNPDSRYYALMRRALTLLPHRLEHWLDDQLQRGRSGFVSVTEPATVLKLLLLSLFQWGWIVAAVWACAMSAGTAIPLAGAIAVFVLTVIGLTLPSSPMQLGTLQLSFVYGLELVDVEPAVSLAASFVYIIGTNLVMLLIGGFFWFTTNWYRSLNKDALSAE